MGQTDSGNFQLATEQELEEATWNFDGDEVYRSGYWQHFANNEHSRIIVEKVRPGVYCTRTLMRSRMVFEMLEECDELIYWRGILYWIRRASHQIVVLARSWITGDYTFRQIYRSLGGTARW